MTPDLRVRPETPSSRHTDQTSSPLSSNAQRTSRTPGPSLGTLGPPSPGLLGSVGAPPRIAAASTSQPIPPPTADAPASVPHLVLPPLPPPIRTAPAIPRTHNPDSIRVYHPANRLPFLNLPAYDHLPGPHLQFGCLHETVVTACTIIAFNRPGYLATSYNRDRDRVQLPLNSVLLPGRYFYHLDNAELEEPYPICCNFREWDFPHGKLPSSWLSVTSTDSLNLPSGFSQISSLIKSRDKVCLVSRGQEYLTKAHIVPKDEDQWVCRMCNSSSSYFLTARAQ